MKNKEFLLIIIFIFLILKCFSCEYELHFIKNKYEREIFNFKNKLVNKGLGKWKLNDNGKLIFVFKGDNNGKN